MHNILIVDDEKEIVELVADEIRMSLSRPCEIDMAFDGLEGIQKTLIKKYDLIISDYKMPKVTGVEFISTIKVNDQLINHSTPVIFLSGFIPDVRKLMKLGDNILLIEKPYGPESFMRNIKMLLGK